MTNSFLIPNHTADMSIFCIKSTSGINHFLEQGGGFKSDSMLLFQLQDMIIDIAYSPGVCVAKNTAPVWRKPGSVDHRQVHVLRPIADSILDTIRSLVNGPGKH